jgi:hypothetical protein
VPTALLFFANRRRQRCQITVREILQRNIKIMWQQPTPRIALRRVPLIRRRPKIALMFRF